MQIVQFIKHISYKRLYAVKKQIMCLYIATKKRLLLPLLICYMRSKYIYSYHYLYLLTHLFYLRFTCKFYSFSFYFIYLLTYSLIFVKYPWRQKKIIQKILLPLLMLYLIIILIFDESFNVVWVCNVSLCFTHFFPFPSIFHHHELKNPKQKKKAFFEWHCVR